MTVAAVAAAVAGREWAALLGLIAAVILLDWIAVQVAITGYTSLLQPLFFVVGLVIFGLRGSCVGKPPTRALPRHDSERLRRLCWP